MNFKSLILFLASIFVIALIYNLPMYNSWMERKIIPVANIPDQLEHIDIEERRVSRYGYTYSVLKDMQIKLSAEQNVVVLIPPQDYLRANKINDFDEIEPSLFYYFTGLNSVGMLSPNIEQATWAIVAGAPGQIMLSKFHSRKDYDYVMEKFIKYKKKI